MSSEHHSHDGLLSRDGHRMAKQSSVVPVTLRSPGGFCQNTPPQWTVYLHGFRSSPSSMKAQKMADLYTRLGLASQFWVPSLPVSPAEALEWVGSEIGNRLAEQPNLKITVFGSSLGGFYATVLAERYAIDRVVLLNPAVKPWVDLENQTGKTTVYFSDEEIEFLPAFLDQLRQMEPSELTGLSRYLLVAATEDEVLDAALMQAHYHGAHQLILEGSDHQLTEFDEVLPLIRVFTGLA